MAGFSAEQIRDSLGATVALSLASDTPGDRTADIISNIMTAFNIEASRSMEIADVLSTVVTSANTNLDQMGHAFKYIGQVAASTNLDLREVSAAMGILGDSGLQASIAGTGLRKIVSSLAGPTARAERILRGYGFTMEEVSPLTNNLVDIVDKLAAAQLNAADALQIFGLRGAPAFLALMNRNSDFREFAGTLQDVEGAAVRIQDVRIDNLLGDLRKLVSVFNDLFIQIFDAGVDSLLRNATQSLTVFIGKIQDMVETIGSNPFLRGLSRGFGSVFSGITNIYGGFFNVFNNGVNKLVDSLTGVDRTLERTNKELATMKAFSEHTVNALEVSQWMAGISLGLVAAGGVFQGMGKMLPWFAQPSPKQKIDMMYDKWQQRDYYVKTRGYDPEADWSPWGRVRYAQEQAYVRKYGDRISWRDKRRGYFVDDSRANRPDMSEGDIIKMRREMISEELRKENMLKSKFRADDGFKILAFWELLKGSFRGFLQPLKIVTKLLMGWPGIILAVVASLGKMVDMEKGLVKESKSAEDFFKERWRKQNTFEDFLKSGNYSRTGSGEGNRPVSAMSPEFRERLRRDYYEPRVNQAWKDAQQKYSLPEAGFETTMSYIGAHVKLFLAKTALFLADTIIGLSDVVSNAFKALINAVIFAINSLIHGVNQVFSGREGPEKLSWGEKIQRGWLKMLLGEEEGTRVHRVSLEERGKRGQRDVTKEGVIPKIPYFEFTATDKLQNRAWMDAARGVQEAEYEIGQFTNGKKQIGVECEQTCDLCSRSQFCERSS